MSKYIFAIHQTDPEFTGVDYNIIISKKDYFKQFGYIQDSYSEQELDEIYGIMDKYNAVESMESCFECVTDTADQIKTKLNNEELFEFSDGLQAFVNTWDNESQ